MNSKRILVPLDLLRGSPNALLYVREMAMDHPVSVTLLHVVDVNIAPIQPGVYEELRAEAEAAMRKLAKLFLGSDQAARVVVRLGNVSDQIVAESKEEPADMIVLCGPKSQPRFRLFRQSTTRYVLTHAPCPSVVLPRPNNVVNEVFGPQDTKRSERHFAFVGAGESAAAA
jgi:nucleotide-binding universal stress UspA family protein